MTPQLPPPLRPWAAPLGLLHHAVVAGVGPWLSPLRELVGPMALPRAAHSGEPDGLAGLSPRGSYDRLVLAEWAVALELPDEFVRRAVMGEHVFLSPAYREPHGAQTSVALLDAGPLQLGGPRLAHLAALVILAQRAKDSDAEFRFGVLQDPTRRLLPLDRRTLMTWSTTVHAQVGTEDHEAWRSALDDIDAKDRWIIGAPEQRALAAALRAGLMSITEPLVADGRTLDVAVQRPAASGGRTTLALPPIADCIQALRHPVSPLPAPAHIPKGSAPPAGLGHLTLRGDRLVVGARDQTLQAIHVPESASTARARTKEFEHQNDGYLVAVDIFAGRAVALMLDRHRKLVLGGSGLQLGRDGHSLSNTFVTDIDASALDLRNAERGAQFFVGSADRHQFRGWILDGRHSLYEFHVALDGTRALQARDHGCLRFARYGRNRIAWASASQNTVLCSTPMGAEVGPVPAEAMESVVFGPWSNQRDAPIVGVRSAEDEVRVHNLDRAPIDVAAPSGSTPVGVLPRPTARATRPPQLVVLSSDRRRVIVTGHGGESFTTSSPIVAWRYHPENHDLLWRDEAGTVGVDRVWPHRARLRLSAKRGGA
ncbi:MAG: hypothetical protein AAF721_30480 [Myxococcota bacterium]